MAVSVNPDLHHSMTHNQPTTKYIQSLDRALELLNIIASAETGISLTELSREAKLNSSTAYRLLSTLVVRGYAYQDPANKTYRLGAQSLYIGQAALTQIDLRQIAIPLLKELADETNELANLVELREDHAVYIAQERAGNRAVQMFTQLGVKVPLHCSGVGKAMLANLEEVDLQRLIEAGTLEAYTVNTISNPLKLRTELDLIRKRNYATDNEEREVGVRCIAAPVFQAGGRAVAAVSISGPPARLRPENDQDLSQFVIQAAGQISKLLGHPDHDQGETD